MSFRIGGRYVVKRSVSGASCHNVLEYLSRNIFYTEERGALIVTNSDNGVSQSDVNG